ncbi:MAG TPA: lipase [Mycobacteriales bacterium]|nr:lipase [Mycobacteriales bacterium]
MSLRRLVIPVVAAALLVSGAAAFGGTTRYAPLDRPGPPLSVSAASLRAALHCHGDLAGRRTPVLLVPGTTLDPEDNFGWNYERAFTAQHRPWCAITLPDHALGDIQRAGEYVVYAIRTMSRRAERRIDILGYSQGGMVPRWALRFWPDTRRDVDDLVGIDPSNHGTLDATALCRLECPAAFWQQASTAKFIAALNSRAETFRGISYTVIYSRADEVVVPNLDASGSSSLHTGKGRIRNVAVQEICPADVSDHLAMGSYDPVAYALAVDALDHAGPADPARIGTSVCTQPFQPGVDPAQFPANYLRYIGAVGANTAATRELPAEPPLAPYVFQ